MPADEYGRSLPRFTVNLLVADVARGVAFYRDVMGAVVHYFDPDFAALWLFGVDPDALEARARAHDATVLAPAADKPHGWREVWIADPDGYVWAVGVPTPK